MFMFSRLLNRRIKGYLLRFKLWYLADHIILSYPKCGRTWVRIFLRTYLAEHFNRPEDAVLRPDLLRGSELPKTYFTHLGIPFIPLPGRNLFPSLYYRMCQTILAWKRPKVIFLMRDPKDVIVSHFHQVKKRTGKDALGDIDLPHFLRHRRYGIRQIVKYMNRWYATRHRYSDFLLLRYEDCRTEPDSEFRRLLHFIGISAIDDNAFEKALKFSSFNNMKALERTGSLDRQVRPGNIHDPESYKVRKGKIGGYKEYLTEEDRRYAEGEASQLNRELQYV